MKSVAQFIEDRTPEGIATGIAQLITSGKLLPEDRLPTVRDLAIELGVSPATVSNAWQTLSAAGLIVSRGRSGSFVRDEPREWLPRRYRGLDSGGDAPLDLSRGTPDPALLPTLGPSLARVANRAGTSRYQEKPNIPELDDFLRQTWPASIQTVTVVNGALDGIDRALGALVRFGDRVAVENPTFPPFLDLLEHYGAQAVGVDLDSEGMRPESFVTALGVSPVAVLLQTRSHNPTGISMSPARAEALAGILARSRIAQNTVVLEDDHSGYISSSPEVTLGRWIPERVLHVRSFSKSHGPDLRIGAIGGPREIIDRIASRRLLGPGWTSRMVQALLYDLLTHPEPVAQIDHARSVYARRQEELAQAVSVAGGWLARGDGINAWLRVTDSRAAVVQLASLGIRVAPGEPFQLAEGQDPHVRVTVGMLSEEMHIIGAALALAQNANK